MVWLGSALPTTWGPSRRVSSCWSLAGSGITAPSSALAARPKRRIRDDAISAARMLPPWLRSEASTIRMQTVGAAQVPVAVEAQAPAIQVLVFGQLRMRANRFGVARLHVGDHRRRHALLAQLGVLRVAQQVDGAAPPHLP